MSPVAFSNTIPSSPHPTILHKSPATTQEAAETPVILQQDIFVESLNDGSLFPYVCRRDAGSRHIGAMLSEAESSWAEGRLI